MFRTRYKLLASGFALAMIASACGEDLPTSAPEPSGGGDTAETIIIDGNEIELTSGLAQFGDCSTLLTHLQTEGAERVGPWGFDHGDYWGDGVRVFDDAMEEVVEVAEEAAMEESDAMADSADSGGAAPASVLSGDGDTSLTQASNGDRLTEGEDFSGTNNQEVGVDEPDYVKTDGNRILTMTNGVFTYVDIDGSTATVRGSVRLDYSTQEMLVVGDTVYLFGTSWGEDMYYEEDFVSDDAEVDFAADIAPAPFQGPSVRVIQMDISNPDAPKVDATLDMEGHYLSARLIGDNISVAVQSDQHDLGFVFPRGNKGEEVAESSNKEIVANTEISDWLPSFTLDRGGDVTSGQLTDCANVHAPADFAGFGSLSVVSIDGASGLDTPGAASVLASGQNIYASTNSMWISTNQWYDWASFDDAQRQAAEERFTSQIHGFAIGGATPEYLASGSVRGHLLNQFAMSEFDGVLRVATTDGSIWGRQQDSESFVTTFAIEDDGLRQLGQVGEMGKGEQIFAVRFVGETGYVVTFRQTDPFYTVDLSDPANPTVLGELKITGFSGQLHPLGPNHVLGIGQEATEDGRETGAKVTLFDVSDLANPTDVANWTVDNSWSDAQWDHKAFLWWPQENLAVLPVQNWSEQFFGAIAFRVDLDAGTLTEAGRVAHEPDEAQAVGSTDCRVLDGSAFDAFAGDDTELGYMAEEFQFLTEEDGVQIQDCASGQTGAAGMSCERWDWIEMTDEQRSESGIDGVLEFCWHDGPGQDPIVRTIVIGDTLWSLSWSRLQANDLATLDAGSFVSLG